MIRGVKVRSFIKIAFEVATLCCTIMRRAYECWISRCGRRSLQLRWSSADRTTERGHGWTFCHFRRSDSRRLLYRSWEGLMPPQRDPQLLAQVDLIAGLSHFTFFASSQCRLRWRKVVWGRVRRWGRRKWFDQAGWFHFPILPCHGWQSKSSHSQHSAPSLAKLLKHQAASQKQHSCSKL